jgi:hypothetical protein
VTTLPDWLVERAALGELPAASRSRIAQADAAALAARVAELREQDAAELRANPPEPALAAIEREVGRVRARQRARRRRMQAGFVAVAGAAVALVLVLRPRGGEESRPPPEQSGSAPAERETTRVKGDLRLVAFRKTGEKAERLAPGATVRAGDVLQLRFNGAGRRHGVIASIDGAGAVTLHFPDSEDAATDLPVRTTDLPHAYALDDAPRFERFFFIADDQPIDVAATLARLRALAARPDSDRAPLDLPPHVRQLSLLLHKAPPR